MKLFYLSKFSFIYLTMLNSCLVSKVSLVDIFFNIIDAWQLLVRNSCWLFCDDNTLKKINILAHYSNVSRGKCFPFNPTVSYSAHSLKLKVYWKEA